MTGTLEGALWGAFSGMAFFAIGTEFAGTAGNNGVLGSSYTGPELVRASVAHGVAGGTISKLQGGRFGHGFLSAGLSKLSSPAIHTSGANRFSQVAMATVVGGSVSSITGGKFANGAVTAAMAYAFNSLSSSGGGDASASAQYDDEGYLIGGFSPASGVYARDDGLILDLTVSDYGTLVDGAGNHHQLDLYSGYVHKLHSGRLAGSYPETWVGGGRIVVDLGYRAIRWGTGRMPATYTSFYVGSTARNAWKVSTGGVFFRPHLRSPNYYWRRADGNFQTAVQSLGVSNSAWNQRLMPLLPVGASGHLSERF